MSRLPISIVIPVSRDERLAQCLRSIDAEVEVVVVLNNHPSTVVEAMCRACPLVRTVSIVDAGCNLAFVFNRGIEAARNDAILLMNSDCTFPPGLIEQLAGLLDTVDIVKARVRFSHRCWTERLVAECRCLFHEHFNGGQNLFGPGLAFRRRIRDGIGGYFFDTVMGWGEDGDLSKRIHAAGIQYRIADGFLEHGPEGVVHDLGVAARIGRGRRKQNNQAKISVWRTFVDDVGDTIFDRKQRFRQAWAVGRLPLLSYYAVWRIAMYSGHYAPFLWRK